MVKGPLQYLITWPYQSKTGVVQNGFHKWKECGEMSLCLKTRPVANHSKLNVFDLHGEKNTFFFFGFFVYRLRNFWKVIGQSELYLSEIPENTSKTNFHMKGFAPGLVLKQRQKATHKWPVSKVANFETAKVYGGSKVGEDSYWSLAVSKLATLFISSGSFHLWHPFCMLLEYSQHSLEDGHIPPWLKEGGVS